MAIPRGQKPKPTQLKLVNGNPGKRPLSKKEAVIDTSIYPKIPEHLSGYAKEEWDRICGLLYEVGLMTIADRTALMAYCVSYNRWRLAEEELEKEEFILYSNVGNAHANPLVNIASTAMKDMMRLACEFGMTPSSRTRVEANPPDAKSKEAKKAAYY
jgi:P27 family predicted phage terminase small subunit